MMNARRSNCSIFALMIATGFVFGFLLASWLQLAAPVVGELETRNSNDTSAPLALCNGTSACLNISSAVADSGHQDDNQSPQLEPQPQPQSIAAETARSVHGEFPSDLDEIKNIFARMEETKTVQLQPTTESFHQAVTKQSFQQRIVGEETLQKHNNSRYFFQIPELDPSVGGVAIFTNAFVLGEPPIVFDGNVVYHQESCGQPLTDDYYEKLMKEVSAKGTIKIQPTTQQFDVLTTVWAGRGYYHALMESLPRLAYVRDFVTKNKDLVGIWAHPKVMLAEQLPTKLWNPVLFGSTKNDDAQEGQLPRWGGHYPQQVLFAKQLLVPTGSHCVVQPKPGKLVQGLFHSHFAAVRAKQLENNSQQQSTRSTRTHDVAPGSESANVSNSNLRAPPQEQEATPHSNGTFTERDGGVDDASQQQQQEEERPIILLQHRTASRSLVNGRELRAAMIDTFSDCCDVKNFYPPDHTKNSFLEDAMLHNEASVIVGPHGAGLANILFSDPSKILGMLEIHPKRYNARIDVNTCHQASAKALGIPSDMLIAKDGDKAHSFTANITQVLEHVRMILSNVTSTIDTAK